MNIVLLADMAAGAAPDRVAVGTRHRGLTNAVLLERAGRAAALIVETGASHVVYAAEASPHLPVALFGAAWAGVPFAPVNYRLADAALVRLIGRLGRALVIGDAGTEARFGPIDAATVLTVEQFAAAVDTRSPTAAPWSDDPEGVAVLLHTSGTSGDPKAAVLRHRHLTSYVLGSVEFLGAAEDEAALVSVPPYHIAGVAAILTGVYGGRRLVQLPSFSPAGWVELARSEQVTHAMTVPTMLTRILDVIDPAVGGDGAGLASVRHLSSGGGRMPVPVIERALGLLPDVDFVNAYGLTETSSSIAVLTPQDHRHALGSDDPVVRARLGSVGRPLPTVEISVRDSSGNELGPGHRGEVWVRGEQVSGEYAGSTSSRPDDGEGWFRTRDEGWFDEGGYLYVEGRLDEVIVRGGENISPGEIEDALLAHPGVAQAAVVGVRDDEWGEVVAAAVVLRSGARVTGGELADWVVAQLRSSRRPVLVEIRSELPVNDTGKLVKRVLRDELGARHHRRRSPTEETPWN